MNKQADMAQSNVMIGPRGYCWDLASAMSLKRKEVLCQTWFTMVAESPLPRGGVQKQAQERRLVKLRV